jgi:hypothetical protein
MIDGPPSRFGLNELSIPAISPGGGFDRHRRHLDIWIRRDACVHHVALMRSPISCSVPHGRVPSWGFLARLSGARMGCTRIVFLHRRRCLLKGAMRVRETS